MLNIALMLTAQFYWSYSIRAHANSALPTFYYPIVIQRSVTLMRGPPWHQNLYTFSNIWPNLDTSQFTMTVKSMGKPVKLIDFSLSKKKTQLCSIFATLIVAVEHTNTKTEEAIPTFTITYISVQNQISKGYEKSPLDKKHCNRWAPPLFVTVIFMTSLTRLFVETSLSLKLIKKWLDVFSEMR